LNISHREGTGKSHLETRPVNLGWCDICLKVANAQVSREFYAKLGFRRVEGKDTEGWAVVTNGDLRLGLYQPEHVGDDSLTINFRGGDVVANCRELEEKGIGPIDGPRVSTQGGASATFRDPDGNSIFLDTAPGEVKPE